MDRVRIFNRRGLALCDLRVTVERTWVDCAEGEAEFDIVVTDPNCREDYLRFGNWLLVENDKLPPWVGMIDVPQEWKQRYVHVHAYTPERQFMYRGVPKQLLVEGKSGHIFENLIYLVNRPEATILSVGSIFHRGHGFPCGKAYGDNLAEFLKELQARSGNTYTFTPVVNSGKLSIYANWHKKAVRKVNLTLAESYNLEDGNTLKIQGDFRNELWGYGNGGGQTDRPVAEIEDNESISVYGLRQGGRVYTDLDGSGQVQDALNNEINSWRWPRYAFQLSVTDTGDSWNLLSPGCTYPLRMWSVGFGVSEDVTVRSMYYNPMRGKVDIVTDEVNDDCQG